MIDESHFVLMASWLKYDTYQRTAGHRLIVETGSLNLETWESMTAT